jgi:hypothetical protein
VIISYFLNFQFHRLQRRFWLSKPLFGVHVLETQAPTRNSLIELVQNAKDEKI